MSISVQPLTQLTGNSYGCYWSPRAYLENLLNF